MTDLPLHLEPATSALLVMDFQASIVDMVADNAALVERTARLVAAARARGLRTIYVVVGFRPGYPEVSARNASFSQITQTGRFAPSDPGAQVHPAIAPHADDVVVTKHRVSAFAGTDLDIVLRANRIETLVLAGIATSGVVLSTVRHAADADYRLVVVEDCCADRDPEVHATLVHKVFARQATVTSSAAVITALGATAPAAR
ncbi:MAG TPA: cysteine hydrolase [Kofleriaceae bacterium]|nr:cysteine hydrolase [Kofleriaceae bacterium]